MYNLKYRCIGSIHFLRTMKDKEFLFRLVNSKDVLLFIGAGFSIPSGMPSGNELKEFLVEDLKEITGLDMSDKSLQDICDLLKNELGHVKFIKLLADYLNKTSTDKSSHDLLANIPFFDNIVTTNYDSYIEDAFGDKCIVKVSDRQLGIYEKGRVCIYKIHGDFSHPQQIIITKGDYARFSNDPNNLIWNEVKGLMSKKAILFIGYSLDDVHVYNYLFGIIGKKGSKKKCQHAYFVAPGISKEDKKLLRFRGITPINSTGKDLLIELQTYLKSNIINSYRRKETDQSSFSSFMAANNISVKMCSSEPSLTDFKPIDPSKPFESKFHFGLNISLSDTENLEKIGSITEEGGLRIPGSNLYNFRGVINDIEIMNNSNISYIEIQPTTEEVDILYTDAEGKTIYYPHSKCYKNSFAKYDLRFLINRKLYSINLYLNFVDDKIKGTFTLDFHTINMEHTGLKEELRELWLMTSKKEGCFNVKINNKNIPLEIDMTSLSNITNDAVIYYGCLNKLVIEKNIRIQEFPEFSSENLEKALILYSYFFDIGISASTIYHSDKLTLSSEISLIEETTDFVESFNNNLHAIKLTGERNNITLGDFTIQKLYNCMVVKNAITQRIEQNSGVYNLSSTSKTSDIMFFFTDNAEKIDVLLSKHNNVLDLVNPYQMFE